MLICGVIASVNTGMVEFDLHNWKLQTVAFGSDGVVAKLCMEIP